MARDEKRRDPGEFYPGGKVWVKPGRSQPQGRVTWDQIEGKPQIAPLPDRYRDDDMKLKINEIASKFATVLMAALIGWSACADVTVQKKRKDEIFNDELIVVDVAGGGGSSMETNAVRDIIHATIDGAARPLPKYLHALDFDDSYPGAAEEYYRSRGDGKASGGCSAVREGNFVYRNFDYPFDERAEFVVKMTAGPGRLASVGVAQVGTNLTEEIVTSGKHSRWYKALPGATVDGINENGVAAAINVVDGEPQWGGGVSPALHPLAAVRWTLDHATNAQHAAEYIASHISFPSGWAQNFHYMIADGLHTYIVEDGSAKVNPFVGPRAVLTNYRIFPPMSFHGEGWERLELLSRGANITNAWYTNAYRRETNPPWVSDLADVLAYTNDIYDAWGSHPKEHFRNKTNGGEPWWQTVHTSVYDITNRTLRVAVQEEDDWYVFQVPHSGGVKVETALTALSARIEAMGDALAGKVDKEAGKGLVYTYADGAAAMADVVRNPAVGLDAYPTITQDGKNRLVFQDLEFQLPRDYTATLSEVQGKRGLGDMNVYAEMGDFYSPDRVRMVYSYDGYSWPGEVFGADEVLFTGAGIEAIVNFYKETVTVYVTYPLEEAEEFSMVREGLPWGYPYDLENGLRVYFYKEKLATTTADSFTAMLDATLTNQTARTTVGAKVMTLVDQPVSQKINASVSANLNTYVDGETGVEYRGTFYGGSFYYVPTGNVYPPNN